MSESILAFRPARVVERLAPRSEACPLSLRDVLGGLGAHGLRLPLVRAPGAGVARAALIAAKLWRSALAIGLPRGAAPEPWFEAVTLAADEVAPRLPICLSAEVVAEGGSEEELERARARAWRLVEAGITHLAVDLESVPAEGWAEALARIAEPAREREMGVDLLLPRENGLPGLGEGAAVLEGLRARGLAPDLASARCPLPVDGEEERAQERFLLDLCGFIEGTPVLRRGPVTAGLLERLAASPVKGCEDGGAAEAAAARALGIAVPADAGPALGALGRRLPPEIGDRPEALAYVESAALLETFCSPGSAPSVAAALLGRAAEG